MDLQTIIFWTALISTAGGLFGAARNFSTVGRGWTLVLGLIVGLLLAGKYFRRPELIYAAGSLWVIFVVLPSMMAKAYNHRIIQQRYTDAYRWARAIALLHPSDGWREQPRMIQALACAQQGDFKSAVQMLDELKEGRSSAAVSAIVHLFRLTNQWEAFLRWLKYNPAIAAMPDFLPAALRAHGETGDLASLVKLYDAERNTIADMPLASSRQFCSLMLFAFTGRRELVEELFRSALSDLPEATREFWRATTQLFAGDAHGARQKLENLLPNADPPTRLAIERRLRQLNSVIPAADPETERIVKAAATELAHEETFGATVTVFSRAGIGALLLIAINVAVFIQEVRLGAAENSQLLARMGALYPPAVLYGGEWWRPVTAIFLHFGLLHLIMNMIGLWVLGPYVQFALGFWRFLFVYLASGIGSMLVVMKYGQFFQTTVGASGAVFSLVGATAAIMLRGWWFERAEPARQRLLSAMLIMALQIVFDKMHPMVSGTAHMSGVAFGFVIGFLLEDRLKPRTPQQ